MSFPPKLSCAALSLFLTLAARLADAQTPPTAPPSPGPAPAPTTAPAQPGPPPGTYPPQPGAYPPPPPGYTLPPPGYGQPAPYPYPGPYGYPPLTTAPRPGYHLHDGFFLRLGLGAGMTSLTASASDQETGTWTGAGLAFDISVGGAIRPGLIVAGSIHGGSYSGPTFKPTSGNEMTNNDVTLTVAVLSLLVDYYPNPQAGLYFGGDIGFGTAGLRNSRTNQDSTNDPTGLAAGLHLGYEWWLSENWSAGLMAQLSYLNLTREDTFSGVTTKFALKGLQPTLTASFTFN